MSDAFDSIANKRFSAQDSAQDGDDVPYVAFADEHGESDAYKGVLDERNNYLRDLDPSVVQKAWFTLSHLLLADGAHLVDMGCDDGEMAYAMACLNPRIKVTGVDNDKSKINRARKLFKRKNLTFKKDDAVLELFKPETVDAIVNSFVLHEIYSGYRYNETIVGRTLEKQYKALKKNGVLFVRDYARPPPGEFVTLELPDKPSASDDLHDLSEADLLVWYAENAQPRQDPHCRGFFLEELSPKFPNTRLFRLPYKWAYEFMMRKDNREEWEDELPMDYTFFTKREFRKELKQMAFRVEYSAPYWNEDTIKKKFKGKLRLFDDNGKSLGYPETSYILVARKIGEQRSINIEERRPSPGAATSLKIQTMRNVKTGELVDTVGRGDNICEVMPYRIASDGRLKIYLHEGMARGITNAVARKGANIDGKRWSGHMIEPIAINLDLVDRVDEWNAKNSEQFAQKHLGFKASKDAILQKGEDYFPAPDYIDERVFTYYLHIEKPSQDQHDPREFFGSAVTFQAKGRIKEFDAQQIIDAITVGMIPSGRLELQILSLFNQLHVPVETWGQKDIIFQQMEISASAEARKCAAFLAQGEKMFMDVKGSTAGQIRNIHSTFVEEGHTQGAISGLSAVDLDFTIKDNETINTAVVIPLTKDAKQILHAGFLLKHMPVAERHKGNGATASAPSYNLPAEAQTMEAAQKFLANKFSVTPEMVFPMGESYYTHVGITPQRIFPFGLVIPPGNPDASAFTFIPLAQMRKLWKSLSKDSHFMLTIARSYKYFPHEIRFQQKKLAKNIVLDQLAGPTPDWTIPDQFLEAPTLTASEEKAPSIPVADPPPKHKIKDPKPSPELKPRPDKW